jgi:hypothetical protein
MQAAEKSCWDLAERRYFVMINETKRLKAGLPLLTGQCQKDSFCAIYKRAEHSYLLLQVKNERRQSKKVYSTIGHFFIAYLLILVGCKTKGAVRAACVLLRIWPLRVYWSITV